MSLTIFVGCQKSKKTINNIALSTTYVDVFDKKGLFINSDIDTRDDKNVISSNSSSYNGVSHKFDCIKTSKLMDILTSTNIENYPIISVDEIQFFPDLEEFVLEMLRMNKHIICSGLDTDWMGRDFGNVRNLLKYSTDFRKLSAKCKWCVDKLSTSDLKLIPDACRTGKISGNESQIECGGDDKYIPLCLMHHQQHLREIHNLDPFTLNEI